MKLPNKIAIEGHTDSTPYGRRRLFQLGALVRSSQRGPRILVETGLDEDRISQVRGFADQRLLMKNDPTNPSNRRISIIVRNEGLDLQEEKAAEAPIGGAPAAPEAKPVEAKH